MSTYPRTRASFRRVSEARQVISHRRNSANSRTEVNEERPPLRSQDTCTLEKARKRKLCVRCKPGKKEDKTEMPSEPSLPCPICFANMLPISGLSISCAPCGHVLCTDCIYRCYFLNKHCPICYVPIIKQKIIRLYL